MRCGECDPAYRSEEKKKEPMKCGEYYSFESPSNTKETSPRSNAARVVGDIARCWANYFGCYGIEPTHVFLGPMEWERFEAWSADQLTRMVRSAEEAGDPSKAKYVFKNMQMFRTDRPGVTCAICFHEPQSDDSPPARRPTKSPLKMMDDPSPGKE